MNRSDCRGTLKLSGTSGGTRIELSLRGCTAAQAETYALLRGGRVLRAERSGTGFFVAAGSVAGAIILINGTIAGAAFAGISAAERERAFTAVRMAQSRQRSAQAEQPRRCDAAPQTADSAEQGAGAGYAEEDMFAPMHAAQSRRQSAQTEQPRRYDAAPQTADSAEQVYLPVAGAGYAEEGEAEPQSEVGRALLKRANRLFVPPDANAEPFVPRPYVRDEPPISTAAAPIPPIEQQPSCRPRRCGNNRRR